MNLDGMANRAGPRINIGTIYPIPANLGEVFLPMTGKFTENPC